MKIGICTPIENIKKMEEIGFDYIEPQIVSLNKMNDSEFFHFKNIVDNSNIKCEAFNVLFPGEIKLTGFNVCVFRRIRTVKPELSGRRTGNIRTPCQ